MGAPTRGSSPSRPTPESIQVRAHFGSRPLPLSRKLLHERHTRSLPQHCKHAPPQTTNAPPHSRLLSLTKMPAYTATAGTLRDTQLHTYTHRCTHHIHSKNKTRNVPLGAKSSRSRTHTHTPSSPTSSSISLPQGPPPLIFGTLSPNHNWRPRCPLWTHTRAHARVPLPGRRGRLRPGARGARFGFQVWR